MIEELSTQDLRNLVRDDQFVSFVRDHVATWVDWYRQQVAKRDSIFPVTKFGLNHPAHRILPRIDGNNGKQAKQLLWSRLQDRYGDDPNIEYAVSDAIERDPNYSLCPDADIETFDLNAKCVIAAVHYRKTANSSRLLTEAPGKLDQSLSTLIVMFEQGDWGSSIEGIVLQVVQSYQKSKDTNSPSSDSIADGGNKGDQRNQKLEDMQELENKVLELLEGNTRPDVRRLLRKDFPDLIRNAKGDDYLEDVSFPSDSTLTRYKNNAKERQKQESKKTVGKVP